MSQSALLTVCIPTYNRASIATTVQALLPQLTPEVQLKIFDNCSDIAVTEILREHLAENISVVRNSINVGAAGNILKCFEYCDTEWMWLLSDDDKVVSNAIENILATIQRYPDVAYIKFNSDVGDVAFDVKEEVVATGQKDFINKANNFGNVLFLSSAVYNVQEIKKGIKAAYYFTSTFSPHVVFALAYLAINPAGKALFSPANIANWGGPAHETWNYGLVNKSLSDMVYVVQGAEARKTLFAKINARHPIRGTFKIGALQRLAKLLWTAVLAKKQGEQKDMIADYFATRSFIYWAESSGSFAFLFKSAVAAGLIGMLNLPGISHIAGLLAGASAKKLANSQTNEARIIYNRFSAYNKDFRL
jgi:glycosyltransferase involved in cell wall biosynthesis